MNVSKFLLQEFFQKHYKSVRYAKGILSLYLVHKFIGMILPTTPYPHSLLLPLSLIPIPLLTLPPSFSFLRKVIEDEEGVSKGYGFVRFLDEEERSQCYSELDGCRGLGRKAITSNQHSHQNGERRTRSLYRLLTFSLTPTPSLLRPPQMMMPTEPPMAPSEAPQQPTYLYSSYYPWPPSTPPMYMVPSQPYSYLTYEAHEGYTQPVVSELCHT